MIGRVLISISALALVAAKHRRTHFIMGHTGATDYATDAVPVANQHANIHIESSFARPPGFVAKLKDIGYDRGIMGSGWPYNHFAFEWSEMRRLLPAAHHAAVLGDNLARLLGGGR